MNRNRVVSAVLSLGFITMMSLQAEAGIFSLFKKRHYYKPPASPERFGTTYGYHRTCWRSWDGGESQCPPLPIKVCDPTGGRAHFQMSEKPANLQPVVQDSQRDDGRIPQIAAPTGLDLEQVPVQTVPTESELSGSDDSGGLVIPIALEDDWKPTASDEKAPILEAILVLPVDRRE